MLVLWCGDDSNARMNSVDMYKSSCKQEVDRSLYFNIDLWLVFLGLVVLATLG
jgi:hypothetical protein